jgi:hypothetical protein
VFMLRGIPLKLETIRAAAACTTLVAAELFAQPGDVPPTWMHHHASCDAFLFFQVETLFRGFGARAAASAWRDALRDGNQLRQLEASLAMALAHKSFGGDDDESPTVPVAPELLLSSAAAVALLDTAGDKGARRPAGTSCANATRSCANLADKRTQQRLVHDRCTCAAAASFAGARTRHGGR